MQQLKKEWRTVIIALWLVIITIFLFRMDDRVDRIKDQSAKTASTLDSVESVVIGTDAGIVQMSKKVNDLESNVNFIVEKVRRR